MVHRLRSSGGEQSCHFQPASNLNTVIKAAFLKHSKVSLLQLWLLLINYLLLNQSTEDPLPKFSEVRYFQFPFVCLRVRTLCINPLHYCLLLARVEIKSASFLCVLSCEFCSFSEQNLSLVTLQAYQNILQARNSMQSSGMKKKESMDNRFSIGLHLSFCLVFFFVIFCQTYLRLLVTFWGYHYRYNFT